MSTAIMVAGTHFNITLHVQCLPCSILTVFVWTSKPGRFYVASADIISCGPGFSFFILRTLIAETELDMSIETLGW